MHSVCDIDLNNRDQSTTVLGIRFFLCGGCGVVYADVERPPRCGTCDDDALEEIGPEKQAVNYFTGQSR